MSEADSSSLDALLGALREALGTQAQTPASLGALAEAMFVRHRSVLRVRHDVDVAKIPLPLKTVPWYSLGLQCRDDEQRPSRLLNYAAGQYYLQDAGSMLALAAANTDQPFTDAPLVCDLCASPGGKATALLEAIGSGFLLANEPIKGRLAPLAYNLARVGSNRYGISSCDPEQLAVELQGQFDMVLVDAPCSGQALLGRGKQSLAALSMAQVEHSASRARRILSSAVELLKPGGRLVFSTCTFAEEENESQVHWMIDELGLVADPQTRLRTYSSDANECCYRVWPDQHDCAGSFAASLRRSDSNAPTDGQSENDPNARERNPRSKRQRRQQERDGLNTADLPEPIEQHLQQQSLQTKLDGAVLYGWPKDVPNWVQSLCRQGPELAYRTGKTWKPAHAAALLRGDAELTASECEVDDASAKRFMRGESISCPQKGWHVVRWQGQPLGWVKASSGQGKNQLPTPARLECI